MAAQSPTVAAGPDFGPLDETDDLPRTLRREKEARAREARERAAQERAAAPTLSTDADEYSRPRPQIYRSAGADSHLVDTPVPAVVRRFDVPFMHLVSFFLKAVLAAIPALILLGVILWFAGVALETAFPHLVKMKILIAVPN